MTDTILRLVFQADSSSAIGTIKQLQSELQKLGGVNPFGGAIGSSKELSAELVQRREQWKAGIYEQRAEAASAKAAIATQIQSERERSLAAKLAIAESVLEERKRVAALKQTESALLAVKKAEEQVRGIKGQQAVQAVQGPQKIQEAQSRAAIAREQYRLRLEEQKQVGVSGRDRQSITSGQTQTGGLAIRNVLALGNASVRETSNLFGNLLPNSLQQTGAIASRVLGSSGILAGGLSASTIAAGAFAGVVGVTLVAAFTAATSAIGYLTEALQKASREEISAIGQSSEIQRLYEVDQKVADKFYKDLQVNTEIAGRNTSVSGEEIARLNNIILPQILRISKQAGTPLEEVDDRTVELTKRFAILAQTTPGVFPEQVSQAILSATTGQLGTDIKTQEFYKNSGLKQVIEEVAKKQGVDLASANSATQLKVFEEAVKLRVPDALINRAQDAVVSQISAFTDTLFAPRTGVFGILRDLEKDSNGNLKEGTSVYDSFAKTVKLVIGSDGILAQISRILGLAETDPLIQLRNAIESFNAFLETLNNLLKTITDSKGALETAQKSAGAFTDAVRVIVGYGGGPLGGALNPNEVLQRRAREAAGGVIPGPNQSPVQSAVQTGTSVLKAAPGPVGLVGQVTDLFSKLFGGLFKPSFAGHTPVGLTIPMARNAAGGYVPIANAIQQERSQMPSGAQLLIANSSEAVIPGREFQALLDYLAQIRAQNAATGFMREIVTNNVSSNVLNNRLVQEQERFSTQDRERSNYFNQSISAALPDFARPAANGNIMDEFRQVMTEPVQGGAQGIYRSQQLTTVSNNAQNSLQRSTTFASGSIVINALPGMDTNAIADAVIGRIDQLLSIEENNFLR